MHRLIIVGLVMLMLVGCGGQPVVPPTPAADTPVTVSDGYPSPSYPAPIPLSPEGYPLPDLELPEGPAFTLTTPIRASSGTVSGTGQAGVPIRVVNITQDTAVIATTTIAPDGTFTVAVSEMAAGDRIGLMLGDVAGTGFEANNFLRGPGYQDLPMIGIVFTTDLVEE